MREKSMADYGKTKSSVAFYTVSSGNIFKDLGFPNPDEELAKVKLASKINRLITDKGMTQKEYELKEIISIAPVRRLGNLRHN